MKRSLPSISDRFDLAIRYFRSFSKIFGLGVILMMFPYSATGYTRPNLNMQIQPLVDIQLESHDIYQAFTAIGEKLDIDIVFHGHNAAGRHNISIVALPLEQVVARVLRRYRIDNYATVYTSDGKAIVQIDVYGYSSSERNLPIQQFTGRDRTGDEYPLTTVQLDQLAERTAKIEAEIEKSARQLSLEQLANLRDRNDMIEAEEKRGRKPLTSLQIEKLKSRYQTVELEEVHQNRNLSVSQLEILRENYGRMESEAIQEETPLSEEQLLRLRVKR